MLKCLPSFQGAEQALRSGASCPCCGGCRGADSSQRPRYPWRTFYPLPACPSYLGCRGADSLQSSRYPWRSFYLLPAQLPRLQRSRFLPGFTLPMEEFLPATRLLQLVYLGCRGADSSQRPHYPWMSFYPLSAAPNNYLGCPVAIKLDLTRSGYIFWLQNSGLTGEVTKPSRTCYL